MRAPWSDSCVWPTLTTLCLSHFALVATAAGADAPSLSLNDSLLWGPYKPNLYMGVRPRIPRSVAAGLMWMVPIDFQESLQGFRHTCEQNEGMHGYGWDEYDIHTGGHQTIHDAANHLDLTTEFVKIPGGKHGGNWGIRVKGEAKSDAPPDMPTSIFFYVSNEGLGSLERTTPFDAYGYEGDVEFAGETPELDKFNIQVTKGPASNRHPDLRHDAAAARPLDRTMVRALRGPPEALWQATGTLFRELKANADGYQEKYGIEKLPLPPQTFTIGSDEAAAGNFIIIQKSFVGSFEFDILYSSASAPKALTCTCNSVSATCEKTDTATATAMTKAIKDNSKNFGKKYKEKFPAQAPFDKPEYDAFAKSMFSNLLGGIGYFYGDQVIDKSYAPEYDEDNEGFWEEAAEARARNKPTLEGPYELFTAIPSRPFFPRGFLWDEGFHLMPILEWDMDVTIEILRSWFNTMDEDGWIPREQILGAEARSKVPPEFQTQYPHYANPPTLFIVLEGLSDKLHSGKIAAADKDRYAEALRQFYPLMKRNYEWYRKTQKGDMRSYERGDLPSKEGYRWRGRTPTHVLTSGLDDYPRPQPPHPGEPHVDLISWVGLMARSLKNIAGHLGEKEDAATFGKHETAIIKNIEALHWDAAEKTYCDSTIDDFEEPARRCHKGYVSVFPFLTGNVPHASAQLGAVLDTLADPQQLWSPHGIRSLSRADPLYASGENYWRSPVWMNVNFLILDNLLRVASASPPGPHAPRAAELYGKLRRGLVDTVFRSWRDTGFAWEQYDPETGEGRRTQHFTGWTSLVVKMMAMPDLGTGGEGHGEL